MSGMVLLEEAYVRGLEAYASQAGRIALAMSVEAVRHGFRFSDETLDMVGSMQGLCAAVQEHYAKGERP